MPLSVVPLSLRSHFAIVIDAPPPSWATTPIPRWRGQTCRIGIASLWVLNEIAPHRPVEFRVLALFPDTDPPGPRPQNAILGRQFLAHYGFYVGTDYSAIRYQVDPDTRRRQLAPSPGSGRLELS